MRSAAGTILELIGAGAVLASAWLTDRLLALALAGVLIGIVGYMVAGSGREE